MPQSSTITTSDQDSRASLPQLGAFQGMFGNFGRISAGVAASREPLSAGGEGY